jgi:AcrR family transcriptional regulator
MCFVSRLAKNGARVPAQRRFGPENSEVRAQLLDAAEQLMLKEGYAAVTSRPLAAAIGVKQPLVYYYFRTMDELFLAVFQRMSEQSLARLEQALVAEQPIRALWELYSDHSQQALQMEFAALANHRKVVQAEIARYAERFRTLEVRGLTRLLEARGIEAQIHPLVATVLLSGLAKVLVQESALGISKGHALTHTFVEACLRYFEAYGKEPPPVTPMLEAQRNVRPRRATAAAKAAKSGKARKRAP